MSVLQQNKPIQGIRSPVDHGQVEQRSFGVGQHHPNKQIQQRRSA